MLQKLLLLLVIQIFYHWEFISSGPTVNPPEPFVAEKDAEIIYKAMDILGTDEEKISKVLCRRTCKQRKLIAEAYEKKYNDNLFKELEGETSGELRKLYRRLLESPEAILSYDLHDTIHKKRDDYGAVTEIFCASDNIDKATVPKFYEETFGVSLLKDVEIYRTENKEYHEVLRDYCLKEYCEFPPKVQSDQQAQDLAAALYATSFRDAEESKTNFKTQLQTYLQSYCIPDLASIFKHFRTLASCGIEDAIRHAIQDKDTAEAYVTLVEPMENKFRYWAKLMHTAVRKQGTDEDRIHRVLVITSERYLGDINNEYKCIFEITLLDRVLDEFTSEGNYRQAIEYLFGK